MNKATNMFFVGKGGVGKSTSAALNSLFLAQKGFRVLIVSLDPAHNQADIFQKKLSHKASEVVPNLLAIEVDQEYWIKQYLKDIQAQIQRTYSYLTAFNLDKYFKVIRHSPGLEEYALILAFKDIQQRFNKLDFLVFDMPPTALALNFFNLPSLSLIWIEHMLDLRKEIIKKRDILTKIKLMKKERETDKILNTINTMKTDYNDLISTFENPEVTHVNLILNPDKLSLAESLRILSSLKDININLNLVIKNKMQINSSSSDIDHAFNSLPILDLPSSETPLIGVEKLKQFLKENEDVLEEYLNPS
ncbi:MAG: ArsA family ATPase [Thermodesulfobacteriota bacterium]|nr:ArsA family ATPase [Thermodesulfobacteriota bacterium]